MEKIDVLKKILKEKYRINEEVRLDTHLINDFGFESITLMELCVALQKELGTKFPQIVGSQWTTVGSIIESFNKIERSVNTKK